MMTTMTTTAQRRAARWEPSGALPNACGVAGAILHPATTERRAMMVRVHPGQINAGQVTSHSRSRTLACGSCRHRHATVASARSALRAVARCSIAVLPYRGTV